MRAILGSGIGGLSAAFYLQTKFPIDRVHIYESSNRTGGWIRSDILPNGSIFEQGPRTIRPHGLIGCNTLELVGELGLKNEIVPVTASHPAAKNRMIYVHGKLLNLPSKFTDILKTMPPFSKPIIWHLMKELRTRKKVPVTNDESIYSFVERRFGKDIAEYAISPLICGICAGDAKKISVKFLMEKLFEIEQKYGSILKGLLYEFINTPRKRNDEINELAKIAINESWSMYSFKNGLETLPHSLEENIKMNLGKIHLDTKVEKLEFNNKDVMIHLPNERVKVDHVISSLPANKLAALVEEQHPLLAAYLNQIPYVSVVVINLLYKGNVKLDNAFGFLVPPSQNIPILGVIYDSCCFPNKDNTVLTVMMGGDWFKKWFGESPTEEMVLNTALEHLRIILHIEQEPEECKINILKDCIPQYIIGHKEKVSRIERYLSYHNMSLSLCGSSYYGVGINDVIYSSKKAVEQVPDISI